MFNSNHFFKRFFIFIFLISISALSISSNSSYELQFTLHQPLANYYGVAVGDIDGDSDFDFLVVYTYMPHECYCRVLLNDGNGNFTDSGQNLGIYRSWGVYLGDFDRDGDLDAITTGSLPKVYFNDGNGIFTDSGQIIEPPKDGHLSFLGIGNLDNDGDLDFIHNEHSNWKQQIYLNNGDGFFTKGQYFGLTYAVYPVDIADVDNDGDLDFGATMNWGPSKICFNNGDATFTNFILLGDNLCKHCSPKFADFNGDGLIDLVEGYDLFQGNRVYFNMGNNEFVDSGQRLGNHRTCSLAVCDIDNDGDVDIMENGGRTYLNDGNGIFVEIPCPGGGSPLAVADFDGDSDLDLLTTHFYKNNISDFAQNTPPNEPTNLFSSIDENQVILTWEDGNDLQTPLELLTYNLRVATNPGGNDVFYSEVGPENTTPSFGNCWHTFQKVLNLPDGKYYWSVQTVDTGFMRSNWYPEQMFYVGMIEADVDIDPDTLNLKSKGKWITCYVGLPDGYDVKNIDIYTVTLHYDNKSLNASWGEVQGDIYIVKFDRNSFISIFNGMFGYIELKIIGEVSEAVFEGTDTIRIID